MFLNNKNNQKLDRDSMFKKPSVITTHYKSILNQGFVYENGPAGIYSDAAGCGTVFENNVIQLFLLEKCGDDDKESLMMRACLNICTNIETVILCTLM